MIVCKRCDHSNNDENNYCIKFAPYVEDPRIIGKVVGSFQPSEG